MTERTGSQTLLQQGMVLQQYLNALLLETADPVESDPVAGPSGVKPAVFDEASAPAVSRQAGGGAAGVYRSNAPFRALLLKIGAISVAVEVDTLAGIARWPEVMTRLPGTDERFCGAYENRGIQTRVFDSQRLLGRDGETGDPAGSPDYRFIVLLGAGGVGLACSELGGIVDILPSQVRWREHRGRRPWFAGILTEHMCVLLDTGVFSAGALA